MFRKKLSVRLASYMMATAMVIGTIGYLPQAASAADKDSKEAVTFTKAPASHPYAGMPLFDGDPDHYEQYLDAVMDYIGLEGAARFAFDTRGDYVLTEGENAGKTIPGSLNFTDCVQGVSTDFPSIIGLGQSWNKNLVEEVGNVLGNERINKVDYSDLSHINVMACTATSDLRINPLSGRFDEDFSEDPHLSSMLVNEMATGVSGVAEDGNQNGFWQKAVVTTKHFTTYNAQTMRTTVSNNASARALLEYQPQSTYKGVASGAVGGFMSSYGNTNGIPNIISPMINLVKSMSPYGLFSVTDNGSVSAQQNYSNGYDKSYVTRVDDTKYNGQGNSGVGALMAMANSSGASTTRGGDESFKTLEEQVKAGTYGVTQEDVENVARDQIGQLVRCGVLNDEMEDNPFYKQSSGVGEKDDYTNKDNQKVALQAAQESVVLLKNDNDVLPLKKDASVYVSGPMAETRFKTTYAVSNSPRIENSLLSSAAGIAAVGNKDSVKYSSDGQVVNIKTTDGKYIALADKDKGTLKLTTNKEEAANFEKYSWGQAEGYSYKCVDNGKWLKGVVTGGGWFGGGTLTGVEASGTEKLEQVANNLTGDYVSTTMPYRFRVETNDDNTNTYVLESYSESFMGTAPIKGYYDNGAFLKVSGDEVSFTDKLTDKKTAASLRTDSTKFTEEVVADYGSKTNDSDSEYAVVVVGAPTRHSSGEGCDRSDLHLGKGQYQQVKNVASKHPGKTIVVVQTNYPEIIQEIKDNKDVAAIVVQPYAGQYGGYALGQVIYGDVAPTGKLTATWYNTNDVLPKINSYSLPESAGFSEDDIDPRFTYDMTNADPAESGLTYMYTDDSDVTYEFGAGITYSDFSYSNLSVPSGVNADTKKIDVTVDVKNTGNVDTAEVVQLYMSNPDSAYGKYAPQKKLAAFEKVDLKAGETKTVTLSVDPSDIAVWNTNAHEYTLESGNYKVEVGSSSKDIRKTATMHINGGSIGTLDASTEAVNVFDSSYASDEVVYKEVSKAHTAETLAKASRGDDKDAIHNVAGGYYAVMGKGDGSWTAMKNVDLQNVSSIKANVATQAAKGTIELRADSPKGDLLGTIDFTKTAPKKYTVATTGENPDAAQEMTVQELGYKTIQTDLEKKLTGVHDVYVVFKTADARIDTVQFVKKAQTATETIKPLQDLTAKVKKVDQNAYTKDSYAKVKTALEAAEKTLANTDASEEEITAAMNQLVDAVTALQPKKEEVKAANLSKLNKAIKAANAVKRSKYQKASLKTMDQALKLAKEFAKAKPATQLQGVADQLTKNLNSAVKTLELKKGQSAVVGNLKFKVTGTKTRTVTVTKAKVNSYKSVRIPATIKVNGYSYKVTGISANAFKNNKSLKKITVKSKTIKSVGKNAFKGINKKAVIKVPSSKLKAYKKLFAGKGQAKTVKIKK